MGFYYRYYYVADPSELTLSCSLYEWFNPLYRGPDPSTYVEQIMLPQMQDVVTKYRHVSPSSSAIKLIFLTVLTYCGQMENGNSLVLSGRAHSSLRGYIMTHQCAIPLWWMIDGAMILAVNMVASIQVLKFGSGLHTYILCSGVRIRLNTH